MVQRAATVCVICRQPADDGTILRKGELVRPRSPFRAKALDHGWEEDPDDPIGPQERPILVGLRYSTRSPPSNLTGQMLPVE